METIDKRQAMTQLTVRFPPDFDGELHITCQEDNHYFTYKFSHTKRGDEWDTLVCAAEAIIEQNRRKTIAKQ